jgi:CRP-like cAMP-binding protein
MANNTRMIGHAEINRGSASALRPVTGRPASERGDVESDTALERIGTRSVVRRGTTVFYEGDPADSVYRVVSGAIRTSKLMADGRRYVADFLFPGDFFGMNDQRYRTLTAEALCDAIIVRYPRAVFDGVLDRDPRFGRYLLSKLCGGLTSAHDRMLLLGRKTALERIASFLLMMAARESGERIELPMTRVDIADYLGLTVETVSRIMTQLKLDRVIQLPDPAQVVLLDRGGLARIAEGGLARAA